MNRKKILRKQQLTFMLYNFVAFSIIFAVFALIISAIVQNSLYSDADRELYKNRERMERQSQFGYFNPMPPVLNPRIMVIEWNGEGDIINKEQIGTQNYEAYFKKLAINPEELNEIRNVQLSGEYPFRSLVFETPGYSKGYTQLLISVDSEQSLIGKFDRILAVCTCLFVIMSIGASYLLSKRSMKPIITSWERQSEFVENASHELRTPLTIIQNKLELLLTAPQSKIIDKFENIALSLSETRRLSKLTNDLLTLARADSGETQLLLEMIDIDGFVEEVSAPYRDVAASQGKHLTCELESKAAILADKSRIHQLLVILLDNSLKYTRTGDHIVIATSVLDCEAVIEVADTGIGISNENMHHIFERFYREDKARTREQGGTGLGLSIAQWIADSHKGTISVQPHPEKGTLFKITLPKS